MAAVVDWFDRRTGIRGLLHQALDEPIPGGARFAYVFGSGLLFLFLSQVLTGVFLALYYVPSADHAHTTVAYIVKEVSSGSFIRRLHVYGSSAMIVVLLLHIGQTILFGSYKGYRELLWLAGCAVRADPRDGVHRIFAATLQHSRQANPGPQFDDPTRDWSTDMNENVHTLTTTLDLPHVAKRIAARIAYDYVRAKARYLYELPANTTLVSPQQLAPILNTMQRATADVRYSLSQRFGLAAGYWYDSYDAQDFARSPGTLDSPFFPALINLMYLNRPYRAHTASVRLIYNW
jgi:cytochrome b/b6/petB-like protein/putative beta-barrel porin MtrB/PioB